MFANTRAFSGFAVDDIEAAKKFYGGIHVVFTSRPGRAARISGHGNVLRTQEHQKR